MKTLLSLVGSKYRGPEVVALMKRLPQGEPLTLIREPTNEYDRHAIQVWARGVHIGFIAAAENRPFASKMDEAGTNMSGTLRYDGSRRPAVEIDE